MPRIRSLYRAGSLRVHATSGFLPKLRREYFLLSGSKQTSPMRKRETTTDRLGIQTPARPKMLTENIEQLLVSNIRCRTLPSRRPLARHPFQEISRKPDTLELQRREHS